MKKLLTTFALIAFTFNLTYAQFPCLDIANSIKVELTDDDLQLLDCNHPEVAPGIISPESFLVEHYGDLTDGVFTHQDRARALLLALRTLFNCSNFNELRFDQNSTWEISMVDYLGEDYGSSNQQKVINLNGSQIIADLDYYNCGADVNVGPGWWNRKIILGSSFSLLSFQHVDNFSLINGELNMVDVDPISDECNNTDQGFGWVELRHTLVLFECNNLNFKDLQILGSKGDGIRLRTRFPNVATCDVLTIENILIEDVFIDGSYRNGIATNSARDLTIKGCTIQNTANPIGNRGPGFGIDIEAEGHGSRVFSNINILDSDFIDNKGAGIGTGLEKARLAEPIDININNCFVSGSDFGLRLRNGNVAHEGSIRVTNSDFEEIYFAGIEIVNTVCSDHFLSIEVENCDISLTEYNGTGCQYAKHNYRYLSGIRFDDPYSDNFNPNWICDPNLSTTCAFSSGGLSLKNVNVFDCLDFGGNDRARYTIASTNDDVDFTHVFIENFNLFNSSCEKVESFFANGQEIFYPVNPQKLSQNQNDCLVIETEGLSQDNYCKEVNLYDDNGIIQAINLSTETICNLPPGSYYVGDENCRNESFTIQGKSCPNLPDLVRLDRVNITPSTCGTASGEIDLTFAIPNIPHCYGVYWDNGTFGKKLTNLLPGDYCVTVRLSQICFPQWSDCYEVHCFTVEADNPNFDLISYSRDIECKYDWGGKVIGTIPGSIVIDDSNFPAGATYQWDFGNPGLNRVINTPGEYCITINFPATPVQQACVETKCFEIKNNCVISDDDHSRSSSNTVKDETVISNISVFPNPFEDYIQISLEEKTKRITLTDIQGRVLKNVIKPKGRSTLHIATQDIAPGVYFMIIENNDDSVITKKIMKL